MDDLNPPRASGRPVSVGVEGAQPSEPVGFHNPAKTHLRCGDLDQWPVPYGWDIERDRPPLADNKETTWSLATPFS